LFEKFQSFKTLDIWLAGESQAGIYIPYVLNLWPKDSPVKVKGMLLGNPFTNFMFDGRPALLEMARLRGLIDEALYEKFGKAECDLRYWDVFGDKGLSEECQELMSKLESYTVSLVNPLDIYHRCYPDQPLSCQWSQPMVDYLNSEQVKT
jgi:hypothetical protein